MSERTLVVRSEGKKGFVAGLKWTPLLRFDKRGESKEVREHARTNFAKKYVRCVSGDQANAGFYCYDDSVAEDVRPEQLYSFGSLLARNLPADKNILIAWKVFVEFEETDIFVLVDINQGLPAAETVCGPKECHEKVAAYLAGDFGVSDYEIYTNSIMEFPNAHEINAEVIFSIFDKKDKIENVPVDLIPLAIGGALIVSLMGGYFLYSDYAAEQERLAMIEAQKKKDPKPKYLALLATEIGAIGVSSEDMVSMINDLNTYPVVKSDWYLKRINCITQQCITYWSTSFGFRERLNMAMVNHEEIPSARRTLNDQVYSFKNGLQLKGVGIANDLITKDKLRASLVREFEIWRNSQLKINVSDKGKTWPAQYGEMPEDIAVHKFDVLVQGQQSVVQSFLRRYPTNTYWEELDVEVNPLDGSVEYKLKGAFYGY